MRALLLALPLIVGAAPGEIMLEGVATQGALVRGTAPPGTRSIEVDGAPVPLASDGRFLVAFGRDAPPSATLVAISSTGERRARSLRVARVAWPVRNLRSLPRGTPRTPQAIAARSAEIARIEAARAGLQPVEGWRQRFRWPVTGRISGVFGSGTIYAGEAGGYHGGVDVARPTGTDISAPADGVVVLASPPQYSVEGNLLIVDHGLGLSSAFLHLSRIDVPVGARVRQGQRLGAIGATGRATGAHLHWGLVLRGVRIDPQRVAGAMAARDPGGGRS